MRWNYEFKYLKDQAALKQLVDAFSNLADDKDVASQMLLFTEDATVDAYFGDTLFSMGPNSALNRTGRNAARLRRASARPAG